MKSTKFLSVSILLLIILLPFRGYNQTRADSSSMYINNFIVKENLLKNSKIAIIAADEQEKPLENISGTYQFS
ncbi:MAG: hypothetical protein JWQ25_388, partial [Daejeonella sp.]|nr:hypothetical protein [Daejeonella sp.]